MIGRLLVLFFLCACIHIQAQSSDVPINVKKKVAIRIEPDSMYFNSVTSRRFKIRNIPDGCVIKGDFMGCNCYVHDSTIILQPMFVYRDSDVMKYKTVQLTTNERTTAGDYYIAPVFIRIIDPSGKQIDSLKRKLLYQTRPMEILA